MKTLLLLLIGTLFGIWFYNNHSNRIPKILTDNIDSSVEWLKDQWPRQQTNQFPENDSEQQPLPTTNRPEADAAAQKPPYYTPVRSQQSLANDQTTAPEEAKTPRDDAMKSYTRTIRMIDLSY